MYACVCVCLCMHACVCVCVRLRVHAFTPFIGLRQSSTIKNHSKPDDTRHKRTF
ncbi:hypothetical protein WUBG_19204, partial [Wuchereria bancrofti]